MSVTLPLITVSAVSGGKAEDSCVDDSEDCGILVSDGDSLSDNATELDSGLFSLRCEHAVIHTAKQRNITIATDFLINIIPQI